MHSVAQIISDFPKGLLDWITSMGGAAALVALVIGMMLGAWFGRQLERRSGSREKRSTRRAPAAQTVNNDDERPAPREIELETRIWSRPIQSRHPLRLHPPKDRKMRTVAFFNLKGGVGKTTLAANLAATFAARGKNVLVLDLDHQQSLTGLCLTTAQVAETRRSEVAIHHVFDVDNIRSDVLHQIARKVRGMEQFFEIVPAHHELAEREDIAMLKWLRETGPRDVRFALTAAILNSRFKEWADYIFMDCPPRLTTASVNALAVSDFIMAPVLPDAVTMDAVQFLVKHIQQLGDLLPNGGLQHRLGLVANRCPPRFELDGTFWPNVIQFCPADYRPHMTGFNSLIRERVAFRDAAAEGAESKRRFAIDMQYDVATQFGNLADELEAVLRAPATP